MYEGVEMRSPVLNDSQNEPVNLMRVETGMRLRFSLSICQALRLQIRLEGLDIVSLLCMLLCSYITSIFLHVK